MPEEVGEALAQEKYLVKNAKKIGVLVAGFAAQKYGKDLKKSKNSCEYCGHCNQCLCNGISCFTYRKSDSKKRREKEQTKASLYTNILPRSL